MRLAENHEVVEALAANRADHPLDEGILPRGTWSGQDLVDSHALDTPHELVAVDAVAITKQVGRNRIVRERLDELAAGPGGRGMVSDVEVDEQASVVAKDDEREQQAEGEGRDDEEVDGNELTGVRGRKARHVGDGRGDGRCMYLAMVNSATSWPSRASSAWMRRRPQVGLSRAIQWISWRISAASFGRPRPLRVDFQRQ
jgi:hypothetical protein